LGRQCRGLRAGNRERSRFPTKKTLATVSRYVRPGDSVLEIGAGSGRFTLPLAAMATSVTAVDLSPHMLAILEARPRYNTRRTLHRCLEAGKRLVLEPHDVVVAAWSLYRMHDVRLGLSKLLRAARRTLIIVDGDFDQRPENDPPHELLKK